jgi:hypothetical protein
MAGRATLIMVVFVYSSTMPRERAPRAGQLSRASRVPCV